MDTYRRKRDNIQVGHVYQRHQTHVAGSSTLQLPLTKRGSRLQPSEKSREKPYSRENPSYTASHTAGFDYNSKDKKGREPLTTIQPPNSREAGETPAQPQQQDPQPSLFLLKAASPAQFQPPRPTMPWCVPMVPYRVSPYPYPVFCRHHSMGHYPQTYHPRLFYRYPNVSRSVLAVGNHQYTHQQIATISQATMSRETMQLQMHPPNMSQQVTSSSTPQNHEKPDDDTIELLSSNSELKSIGEEEEEIDVVGP